MSMTRRNSTTNHSSSNKHHCLPLLFLLLSVLLLVSYVQPTNAASLRHTRDNSNKEQPNKLEIDFTETEFRHLQLEQQQQQDPNNDPYNESSDAGLINRIISFLLPYMNQAIATFVPDPLDLPFSGEYTLGEIELLSCTAAAGFNFDAGSIRGLSSLAIDNLQVLLGTERVDAGLCNTLWNAVFNMSISTLEVLSVDDLAAGFSASACGLELNPTIGGGIRTYQPLMQGLVNISGELGGLFGRRASISWSDIQGDLNIGYDTISAYMNDVPDAFNEFIDQVTTQLSLDMKEQWIESIEPEVNRQVNASIQTAEGRMPLRETVAINTGFMRNRARRQAAALRESVSNFFTGGVSVSGSNESNESSEEEEVMTVVVEEEEEERRGFLVV